MADAGTDSYEREKGFHLMNRETDYINFLNLALQRIDSGEFGICAVCGKKIPEERMMEVPNATKCVSCKEGEKLNLNKV
jgi:RNA polymerase-binding transcription factor DksA